ncbi:MAG: fatty acid desaturase family protein [Panacagrimonas sp.]
MSTLSVPAVSELRAEPAAPDEELRARDTGWYPQARALVSDLYQRSPLIYWTDFLLSISVAWTLTAIYFTAPVWSLLQVGAFLGASILFFRAGTFIHELVHMTPKQMPQFGRVWNLLMGIPLLAPWILYRNHVDHHSAKYFGTPDDGEYLPLAAAPVTEILKYLAQCPLLPLFVVARFGILAPLSWLHRGLREWVLTYTSAAVSNPYYRKRFPPRDERHLLIVEVLCFLYLVGIGVGVYAGVITGTHLLQAYLLFAFTLNLNWIRNLAAHRYGNRGDRMTHLDQFSDSINITGQTWLTVLLFPVGLRYHALHHLFPSLPYHNLGKAHRLLSERLPADSPYHATGRNSFFAAAADLWRAALRTPREQSAMPRWLRRPQAS